MQASCGDAGMCLQAAEFNLSQGEEHEDDEVCVVCWERPREVIFYRCAHMVRSSNPKIN